MCRSGCMTEEYICERRKILGLSPPTGDKALLIREEFELLKAVRAFFLAHSPRLSTLPCMPNAPLTWDWEPGQREGTTILRLRGPLTLENLFLFQNEFRATQPPVLLVEMSGVPYIDSAGLGLLMNAHVSASRDRRKLSLVAVNPRVMTVFHLTRVDSVFSFHLSCDEAEQNVAE